MFKITKDNISQAKPGTIIVLQLEDGGDPTFYEIKSVIAGGDWFQLKYDHGRRWPEGRRSACSLKSSLFYFPD